MVQNKFTLRESVSVSDDSWVFTNVPHNVLTPRQSQSRTRPMGKLVIFSYEKITIEMAQFPSNRMVYYDDSNDLILASFGGLRFPDTRPSVATDYKLRFFQAGLFLNGVQYRFYGHSNSQLRSGGCFLRRANSDEELDQVVYAKGDFGKIMNVAKRAKRIGLLFSGAEVDYMLDPQYTGDIDDLKIGDEVFSDGCGLISRWLSVQISKKKGIVHNRRRYTPCVFQIRYRGYKGVQMLHPPLDAAKIHQAEFRKSQKKFTATDDMIFSIVDYSKPHTFGRLNNEITILLSSLGVTNDDFVALQQEYFDWVQRASSDPVHAFELFSTLGKHDIAERVLLDGLDSPTIVKQIRSAQAAEIQAFHKEGDATKERVRMLIRKSRRLFGVCDPFGVLKEGQVHVRITVSRAGASTINHLDVIVVRNPCLHPGDILKLRAVDHPQLSHLVDCVVFPSVGKRAAPSMSSGGDLDGDEYFVCWDPRLVPKKISESYTYPPNKEFTQNKITRQDLARHFASYNNSGMAKAAKYHNKWARYPPDGALSKECQELNALYSQAVDGARVSIPARLTEVPESRPDFILDVLSQEARAFSERIDQTAATNITTVDLDREGAVTLVRRLLSTEEPTLSEYRLVELARRVARKYNIDFHPFLTQVNFGALGAHEKQELSMSMGFIPAAEPYIWNSLLRSDILTSSELTEKKLGGPLRVQRLYSSRVNGLYAFFEYMQRAAQDYTRKLVIMKFDGRFTVAIFLRGSIPWDEDVPVNGENVVVAAFMKGTAAHIPTYKSCVEGFRLYCGYGNMQLFNRQRANTFIFIARPPANSGEEIVTSIALQQISGPVQRQIGRLNRAPVVAIEIHVVSNRDGVAHQLFDLRFEHVATEEFVSRFASQRPSPYVLNQITEEELTALPAEQRRIFHKPLDSLREHLSTLLPEVLDKVAELAWKYHAENALFMTFDTILSRRPLNRHYLEKWMDRQPLLVFSLLKSFVPSEGLLHEDMASIDTLFIVRQILRSVNVVGIASLSALERIRSSIASLSITHYLDLLQLASLCVRAPQLIQEVLLTLHECREPIYSRSPASTYIHKHSLAVSCDRAEEANDECPCDDEGHPRRQSKAPLLVDLRPVEDKPAEILAHIRVDAPAAIQLHSHVRLRAGSKPERGWVAPIVLDGLVLEMSPGQARISLMHTAPPEVLQIQWYLYNAGSIATFKAQMDAIHRLATESAECCRFHRAITGDSLTEEASQELSEASRNVDETHADVSDPDEEIQDELNHSQRVAVRASRTSQVTLIWGPPGTGKTTVVVQILKRLVQTLDDGGKILMTASTHNAVDNVLERFERVVNEEHIVPIEQVLRVATDSSRVNKSVKSFTVESRVGGEINRNSNRRDKAEKLIKKATIVFTTCAGAGLGVLRGIDFDIALIDEASQVTESVALIPLVKGCKKAILVGDHVQLRPMVRPLGRTLMHDVSLFERLYTGESQPGLSRTMLDVQYRFPEAIARFPSSEFYNGELRTGVSEIDVGSKLRALLNSQFPWPTAENVVVPVVFVPCSAEEDYGGMSKGNTGQVELIKHTVKLLASPKPSPESISSPNNTATSSKGKDRERPKERVDFEHPDITALSPYTKQAKALRDALSSSNTHSYTIDSFQGRESDIIIFSTVRSNVDNDVGFVEDARRLNVAWTRAKLALIVVGDRRTMTGNGAQGMWSRAIGACVEVNIPMPSTPPQ